MQPDGGREEGRAGGREEGRDGQMMTNARVQNVKRDMTDGDAAYLTGDGQAGRRASTQTPKS